MALRVYIPIFISSRKWLNVGLMSFVAVSTCIFLVLYPTTESQYKHINTLTLTRSPQAKDFTLQTVSTLSTMNPSKDVKSEQWYLSAIRRLSFRKVTPSMLLLEHDYFKPHPKNRYIFEDEEIIRCTKCSDTTHVVILVLSEPGSIEQRRVIRETWGSVASKRSWPMVQFEMDVKIVFVIGVKKDADKHAIPRDVGGFQESYLNSSRNSVLTSNTTWNNSELESEAAKFDDILQLTTTDNYINLTRKVILGMKWITNNCPEAKYIIKADQDIFVNVPMIWQFLKHYGKQNSIYGHIYFHGRVLRSGRWGLSLTAVPITKFPIYASGTAYVVSMDAALKVLKTYSLFRYVKIEDAFITGIVASVAKIDRYQVNGFTEWADRTVDSCKFVMDRLFTANRVTENIKRNFWTELHGSGHGRCK